MNESVEKYLKKYAEPEIQKRKKIPKFQHVIVVPAYDEKPNFLRSLFTKIDSTTLKKTLVIVVINVPDNVEATSTQYQSTANLLNSCSDENCLIVDRVNKPIPKKMGVGLARKIGADLALAYIRDQLISNPIIYTTDADAELPSDYFFIDEQNNLGAWIYPFEHRSKDRNLEKRAICYELHMRWYVEGLRVAGSNYAHHTLGSTIAINAKTYAEVRGYPKRNAGEDFYLLNKIAKTAPIKTRSTFPIILEARASNRVPFGTGPALLKIPDNPEDYKSYNPEVFKALAEAIKHVSDPLHEVSPLISETLNDLHFSEKCERLNTKQRHQWFDGLKTLRFIHAMQAHYPDVDILVTLRNKYDLTHGDLQTLLTHQRSLERMYLSQQETRNL